MNSYDEWVYEGCILIYNDANVQRQLQILKKYSAKINESMNREGFKYKDQYKIQKQSQTSTKHIAKINESTHGEGSKYKGEYKRQKYALKFGVYFKTL